MCCSFARWLCSLPAGVLRMYCACALPLFVWRVEVKRLKFKRNCILFYTWVNFILIENFYCVNASYPLDNCFSVRRDQSRQTTEKVILYIIPIGLVTKCAFARCLLMHTSCLDGMMSRHLFRLAHGVCGHVFCCVVKCEDYLII